MPTTKQPKNDSSVVLRGARIDSKIIDEPNRSIRTVVATENPVLVAIGSWWDREIVREILLMSGCIIPANRQVPLIDVHQDHGEVAEVIKGSIRELEVQATELIGQSVFASIAEDEFNLAREGHLTDVSAGYVVYPNSTYRIKPGESCIINGRTFSNNFNDEYDLLIRTKWEIIEGSLVPIGADSAAKFRARGRNKDEPSNEEIKAILDYQAERFLQIINNKFNQNSRSAMDDNNNAPGTTTPAATPAQAAPITSNSDPQTQERERVSEIVAISNMYRIDGKTTQDAIDNGMSLKDFRALVRSINPTPNPVQNAELGLDAQQVEEYNLCRAIMAFANKDWSNAKREYEYSQEISKKLGKAARGFFVPVEVQRKKGQRAGVNSVADPSTGGYLVPTVYQAGSFVELLRNKSLVFSLGIGQLDNLVGNVLIPKQTGANTAAWVDEQGIASAGNATFGQILMSPKTLMARTELSRLLLLQADPSAQALVMDDLAKVLALGLDLAVFHGTGASNQPTGIANTTGVGSVTGTSFGYTTAIEMETKVADANADAQTMYYVTNPTVYGKLKGTAIASNYPAFLLMNGEMNGYPVKRTKQIAANTIFFGDFSQVLVGNWGVLDVVVDPYTSDAGNLKIKVFQSTDIAVRQPGAFSITTSFS